MDNTELIDRITTANALSFDVWGTLLTANPEFKAARNDYLSERFLLSRSKINDVQNQAKETVLKITISLGRAPSCDEMYQLFLILLGQDTAYATEVKCKFISLFWEYHPIIDDSLIANIKRLAETKTIGIGSNSNFISGNTISAFLDSRKLRFDFYVFSDLIRYAKPSPVFFSQVIAHANNTNVLHIGNDRLCDVSGPLNAGLDGLLIRDPAHLNELLNEVI